MGGEGEGRQPDTDRLSGALPPPPPTQYLLPPLAPNLSSEAPPENVHLFNGRKLVAPLTDRVGGWWSAHGNGMRVFGLPSFRTIAHRWTATHLTSSRPGPPYPVLPSTVLW